MEEENKEFEEEYGHIRKDLKSVLIQNSILLAMLIALYFINRSTGFLNSLENLF